MDTGDNSNNRRTWTRENHAPSSYALNGKIMLCSVIVLFVIVILILCFHSYVRWFFHHQNRLRRRRIRVHLRSLSSTTDSAPAASQALDRSVLETIPVFAYSSKSSEFVTPLECAVCLSEFEENEEGRVLPKCNHVFHVDCIDTWFHSRSNCPLCRAPVQPVNPVTRPLGFSTEVAENTVELAGSVCSSCNPGEDIESGRSSSSTTSSSSSSSSFSSLSSPTKFPPESSRRLPMEVVGVLVDMPRGFDGTDLGLPDENGSKSPGHRVVSLSRIWSL